MDSRLSVLDHPSDRPREPGRRVALAVGLVLLVFAAHGGSLAGGFRYDDHHVIVENPAIRSWTASTPSEGAGFRPVTMMSFAINHAVFGDGPVSYLAVNLGLYACLTLMVFAVGSLLLGSVAWGAVAGAIFAVHPVNTESVNYISARFSLLAGLWTVISVWGFVKAVDSGRGRWLAVALGAFVLALLSKESALAVVIPLAAYAFVLPSGLLADARRGQVHRRLLAVVPFGIVAIIYLAARSSVVGQVPVEPHTAVHPVWTFVEIVWRSLSLWVWPWPLGTVHELTFVQRADIALGALLVAASVAWLALGLAWWRRAPLAVWLSIWIVSSFLMLAPLPWITTKALLMENRILMASAGLAWLTARGVQLAWRRWADRLGARSAGRTTVLVAGTALLVVAVLVDRSRSAVWSDERRLWAEVVERAPDNASAYVELGRAYRDHGELDKAEAVLRRAVTQLPDYPLGYWNLSAVYASQGRYDEARLMVIQGIAREPGFWKGHHLLGEIELKTGRLQDAATAFTRAVALNACDVEALTRLAAIAYQQGDATEARRRYQDAVACDPGNREALNSLAGLAIARRDWEEALAYADAALRAAPEFLEAEYHRAVALTGLGRGEAAREALERVLARMPEEPRYAAYRQAVADLLNASRP
ncbi:MAG: tetratricopeptide repeat protein [Nitrospirota bacterium]